MRVKLVDQCVDAHLLEDITLGVFAFNNSSPSPMSNVSFRFLCLDITDREIEIRSRLV